MTEQGKVKRKPTLAESLMAVLFLIIIIVVGNVLRVISRVDVCCSHLLCRLYWQKMWLYL